MWEDFFRFVRPFTRITDSMGREHWIIVFFVMVVFGLICMRGFGSRSAY